MVIIMLYTCHMCYWDKEPTSPDLGARRRLLRLELAVETKNGASWTDGRTQNDVSSTVVLAFGSTFSNMNITLNNIIFYINNIIFNKLRSSQLFYRLWSAYSYSRRYTFGYTYLITQIELYYSLIHKSVVGSLISFRTMI